MPATKKKVFKFPKKMGTCADKLYALKAKRLEAKKIVDALEEEEKALKTWIIENLPKSQASGIAGKLARVTVVTKEIPQVKDWDKFYQYMSKNKAFDLMQRRLSTSAVEARLDAGKKVPGVEIFNAVSISMNKV